MKSSGIDPKHASGAASTKNRKSKPVSGPQKGKGKEVGAPCGEK